jgi:hypothetical protein
MGTAGAAQTAAKAARTALTESAANMFAAVASANGSAVCGGGALAAGLAAVTAAAVAAAVVAAAVVAVAEAPRAKGAPRDQRGALQRSEGCRPTQRVRRMAQSMPPHELSRQERRWARQ